MKKKLLRYWLAMNASAVQASAHAGNAYIGAATAHVLSISLPGALSGTIPAITLGQIAGVLGFAFIRAIFDWLDKNPIPVNLSPELDNAIQAAIAEIKPVVVAKVASLVPDSILPATPPVPEKTA